jgi:hypothetical protein
MIVSDRACGNPLAVGQNNFRAFRFENGVSDGQYQPIRVNDDATAIPIGSQRAGGSGFGWYFGDDLNNGLKNTVNGESRLR